MHSAASPLTPTDARPPVATSYQPALTGLRAVAAWLIFGFHFNPFAPAGATHWLHAFVREWYTGVTVFFVLSGLLLGLRYQSGFSAPGTIGRYLRSRAVRILPLYWLVTLLTFGVAAFSSHQLDWLALLLNLTLLRGFFEEYLLSGVSQGWSLTTEAGFYLLVPLLAVKRFSAWWLVPLLWAVGVLLAWLSAGHAWHGFMQSYGLMWHATPFGRILDFVVGWQVARWYRQRLASHVSVAPRRRFPWLTCGGVVGFGVLLVALAALSNPVGHEHPLGAALHNLILPFAVAALLAGLLTEHSWLRTLLASRPLQVLGLSSYAFFLLHMGVAQRAVSSLLNHSLLPVQFVLLQLLAVGVYYLIERPLDRVLGPKPTIDNL
ncbi:acyltransferase family protein [Hymenobacter busanensis]|uniref:acyltransferase family protein n=1 Tax=Hymenobacter busanensis TaxID=2607656 RepID=UPI0021D2D59F|nr:acyltransferase [Hymenobacter busanensis]